MTKETLKGFGLTDEQVEQVMGALKGFIPKARFDEVNSEKNQLKAVLNERDSQLETLKNSASDVEGLKKKITELQNTNAEKDKVHAAEMKRLKRETLDDKLLSEANAINTLAIKPFLAAIDESVDDDEGYIALRKQQIEALTKTESTKFLFKMADGTQTFTGTKPGEALASQLREQNPFAKDTYDEAAQIKLFRENPVKARQMAKQAEVSLI